MSRAGELERRRLGERFERLSRPEHSAGRADRIGAELELELGACGVLADRDEAGNLLARIGPHGDRGAEAVLLCASTGAAQRVGGSAATAVLLELARRQQLQPLDIELELLFTAGEHAGRRGAEELDTSRLHARQAFMFDHVAPLGDVVAAAPAHFRIDALLQATAAPTDGGSAVPQANRSSAVLCAARALCAMQLGRLDPSTTANIGLIEGGEAESVVPGRCRVRGEARSLDQARAEQAVSAMAAALQEAANMRDCCCDLDVVIEQLFAGYRTSPRSRALGLARSSLAACGHQPRLLEADAGSDADVLNAAGIDCVNLAHGMEHDRTAGPQQATAALAGMLDVAITLLEHAAQS